jgi:hypothetical protein
LRPYSRRVVNARRTGSCDPRYYGEGSVGRVE